MHKAVKYFTADANRPHKPLKLDRVDSAPSPLDFVGAGRRRTPHQIEAEAFRRAQDERTAARLSSAKLQPYQQGSAIYAVDLATQGARATNLGRPLRRWCVFQSEVVRQQRAIARLMQTWALHLGPVPKLIQVRLRPLSGAIPVQELRETRTNESRPLRERLRYASKCAKGHTALLVAEHHKPVDHGHMIDRHFHVVFQVNEDADRATLERYLSRHYSVYISDSDLFAATPEHAQALAAYLASGTARYVDEFSDENLAEYVRQVYEPTPLHRLQTLGPLRKYAGDLASAGLHPTADQFGQVVLARRPTRRPRLEPSMRFTSGPSLLKIKLSWIAEELRPSVLVRGWQGSWQQLIERYDLTLAVDAARLALAAGTFTSTTDIRESAVSAHPTSWRTTPLGSDICGAQSSDIPSSTFFRQSRRMSGPVVGAGRPRSAT